MADATPRLKRKRESAIGQIKKAKKQRKSEATAGQDAGAGEEAVVAAPVAGPTSEVQAAAVVRDRSKPRSRRPQTNGVHDDAPAMPSPNSKPDKKSQRKQDQKDSKKADQRNGADRPVEATEAQGTSAPSNSQVEDADKSNKKTGKKEKRPEAIEVVKPQASDSSKPQASSLPRSKKQKHKTPANWTVSLAQGGWFLPTEPVFSVDEKYLIVANPKSIQIYVTETSLLASVLPTGNTGGLVTAYALSSTKPSQIYVADSNGLITLWDWVNGIKIGRWDIGAMVRNMAVITQPGSDEDLVYCHETGNSHIVNVHALRTKSQVSKTELKRVLKTSSSISSVQVLLQGKYVIISTADSIMIGKRLKASRTDVQDFEYVWRELKFSKRVTTCNTYFRQPEVSDKGKKSAQGQRDILDLAVGDEIGVILLFEDIIASFAAIESSQKGNKSSMDSAESLRPKRFHWHRDAVGSVKWSLDGNYLISGGDETVLTIWQLATGGKPQHLPHLTAAIENIAVSPSGSSYALSLANNSIIVLSTTELEPRTNIIGIQTRRVDTVQLPKESKTSAPSIYMQPVPIAVDPKNAEQVLFTVPSSQPRQRNEGLRPEPYLQTFDIANQRPVARQALTRNNATDPNMAPDGKRILEPNVHLLQVSHDGQWLATVDEWLPLNADMGYLNEGNVNFSEEERLRRREVYFKIWRRDEKKGQWALETRIDAPHFLDDVSSNGRVLDLVAHPKEYGFATIGEDHVVRIWKPKTRLRDGIVVRGAGDSGLVNWSLYRSIDLPDPNRLWLPEASTGSLHARTLRLAFSADGSVLAAGVSGASVSDHGLIHLIDANSASIRRSMTEIDVAVLCGLGIIGRYLIVVTDSIIVWDMVYDNLVYCASISTSGVDKVERTSIVRLAVNDNDGTFAVSLPQFEKYENSTSGIKKASSKILVYNTEQKESLWSHTIPGIILGLAAKEGKGERGYITLDSVSCIRTISPTASMLKLPTPHPADQREVQSIEEVVVDTQEDTTSRALEQGDILPENEYDKPSVTQQDLEEIFHNDNAPQTPKDVFSAMLRLFGGVAKAAA